MDKITIERETLELAASLIQPLTGKGDREVYDALRAALAQKAEPPSMPQGKSLALLDLDSVENAGRRERSNHQTARVYQCANRSNRAATAYRQCFCCRGMRAVFAAIRASAGALLRQVRNVQSCLHAAWQVA